MKLTQSKLILWAAAIAAAFCGAGPGARADYPSQVLSFQPLTYWRFSEAGPSAVTATNLGTLGAAANGTYNSGLQPSADTLVSPAFPGFGPSNTGLAFQGTGQTLVIGYTNIPAPWTFVCWVNPQTPPQASAALMYSSTTALKLDQYNATYMVGFTAYGVADYTFNYSAPDGTWVNLAWVGTGSNTLLYVNGSLQDSNAASITLPMTSIGNPAGDFLNGTVDEVATFGSALLDGEIKTLYLTAVGDQNPPGFVQNVPLISPPGTIYATTPFSLSADAYGAGPLTYQWLKDGTVVGTNVTYAKASASQADGGKYEVIVSNAHGSITSSVVTLAITPALPAAVTQPPAARLVYPAGTASFTVAASGTPPFSYQWKTNGVNIAGATNATLIITNAGPANAATYSVGVTNSAGGAVSAGAALSLTTPAAGSYEAVVLASGPMAYWRLNEKSGDIAYDYQGGYDGVYTNVTLAQPGYSALDTDTSAGFDATQPSRVIVTDSAPFDFVGPTTPFSFEVWANFTDLSTIERLFSNRQTGGNGIGFGVNTATGLRFTTFGVQDFDQALPTPLQTGTWYHLAGVSEGGNFSFYLNGQLAGTVAFSGAALTSPAAFQLGCNPDGSEAVAGDLAEATVYNVALTPAEILTHYSVGQSGPSAPRFVVAAPVVSPAGTIYASTPFTIDAEPYGAGPLSYQWFKDGTLVGTNITYTQASASQTDNGNYDLIVKSAYGSATSAMVTLAVNPAAPPVIVQAPAARPVYPGGTALFSVTAAGTPPLTYQWKAGGVNIAGATNATLFISNASATNAVSYSVGVTNPAGGVVSSGAALTFITPAAGTYEAAVLASGPMAYWRLNEKSGNTAYDYQGAYDGFYSSVTLGQPGYSPLDTDTSAGFDPTQFSAVIVSNSVPFDFSGLTPTFSCEVWGSFTNLSGVERLFSNRAPGWGFGINTATGLRFTTFTVQDFNQTLPTSLQTGTWYHIAGVSEGGNFSFYLNGQLVGTIAFTGALLPSTAPFYLGGNPNQTGGAEAVAGDLAEAAMYNRALTAAEVLEHYAAGLYGTHTAPFIVQQPASQTVPVGASPTFTVTALGSVPLAYQWSQGGAPITGATNSSLTLSNVPFAEAGTFSVTITNAAGQTNSATATLTVLPVPTFANLTNALVLHLSFDGNTADTSGRQNNASAIGTPTFVPGRLNQAIQLSTVQNASYNYLTVSDNNGDLSFTATNSFSVALWLKFTTGFNDLPIIGNAVNSTSNPGWVLTEDVGKFEWTAVGSDTGSVVADPAGGPLINDGNWHHLAVVFDRSASNAVSYVDGQWIDTRSIAGLGSLEDGQSLTIGQDPTGLYAVNGSFALDDLGIWRRALSGYEVLSIYDAAQLSNESFDVYGPVSGSVAFSIARDGAQVILSWQTGTLESADALQGTQTVWTPVAGAAPPTYTFQPSAAHKFYRIKL